MFGVSRILVTGDIADQDTDAVLAAAHWRLNKGVGTDVEFLQKERHNLEEVRIVLYTREDQTCFTVFACALEQILSERIHFP